jgi:hypothetical protein
VSHPGSRRKWIAKSTAVMLDAAVRPLIAG